MAVPVGGEVRPGVSELPLGPRRNILGAAPPLPAREFYAGYHMIDAELFVDDDKEVYLYWGSGLNWVNGRCWAVSRGCDFASLAEEPQ